LEVLMLKGLPSVGLLLDGFLAASPSLLNASQSFGGVWSGYWSVSPVSATQYTFAAALVFNGTTTAAQASAAAFAAFLDSNPADLTVLVANYTAYTSFTSWHDAIDDAETGDRTGSDATLGSRLVPAAVCTDPVLRANASAALTTVAAYVPLHGMMVTGGAVSLADTNSTHTSVTPAWRSSVQHVAFGIAWAANTTLAEVQQIFAGTSQLTEVLRQAWPDSGAYFSESDFLEPNWQTSFWGAQNYARLQGVKAAYDPDGVFTCHHCVELPAT